MVSTASDDVVEVELVSEGLGQTIRQLRSRGKAKKAIARELGLDIKSVRKWLATEWSPQKRGERADARAVRRDDPEALCGDWLQRRVDASRAPRCWLKRIQTTTWIRTYCSPLWKMQSCAMPTSLKMSIGEYGFITWPSTAKETSSDFIR